MDKPDCCRCRQRRHLQTCS